MHPPSPLDQTTTQPGESPAKQGETGRNSAQDGWDASRDFPDLRTPVRRSAATVATVDDDVDAAPLPLHQTIEAVLLQAAGHPAACEDVRLHQSIAHWRAWLRHLPTEAPPATILSAARLRVLSVAVNDALEAGAMVPA